MSIGIFSVAWSPRRVTSVRALLPAAFEEVSATMARQFVATWVLLTKGVELDAAGS
jgi:hypothetical protein